MTKSAFPTLRAQSDCRFDVVAIGNALVDQLVLISSEELNSLGLEPGTMSLVEVADIEAVIRTVGSGIEICGGSETNTAVGVASLGGRAGFVGSIAPDLAGERFSQDSRTVGLATSLQVQKATHEATGTGRCLVLVTPDGERTMLTALGAGSQLDPSGLDADLIESALVVYFDAYLFDLPAVSEVVKMLRQMTTSTRSVLAIGAADQNATIRHIDLLEQIASDDAGVFLANEGEAKALTGARDARAAVEMLRRDGLWVAVTCGAQGAIVASVDELHEIPADVIDAVLDTTGAGDQFAAGFLFGVASGLPILTCGRLGCLAAGEVIGHVGARPLVRLADLATGRGLL